MKSIHHLFDNTPTKYSHTLSVYHSMYPIVTTLISLRLLTEDFYHMKYHNVVKIP